MLKTQRGIPPMRFADDGFATPRVQNPRHHRSALLREAEPGSTLIPLASPGDRFDFAIESVHRSLRRFASRITRPAKHPSMLLVEVQSLCESYPRLCSRARKSNNRTRFELRTGFVSNSLANGRLARRFAGKSVDKSRHGGGQGPVTLPVFKTGAVYHAGSCRVM